MRYHRQVFSSIPVALITLLVVAVGFLPIACENAPSATLQMMPERLDMSVGDETLVEASVWVADRDLTAESGWQWKRLQSTQGGEIVFIYGDAVYWRRDGEDKYSAGAFIRATESGECLVFLKQPEDLPSLGFAGKYCTITITP